jgi:hypothetical protein
MLVELKKEIVDIADRLTNDNKNCLQECVSALPGGVEKILAALRNNVVAESGELRRSHRRSMTQERVNSESAEWLASSPAERVQAVIAPLALTKQHTVPSPPLRGAAWSPSGSPH